jgi:hypothetical protein
LFDKRPVELDIRIDTSLANFLHSQLVNPETAQYATQTKRQFNNNGGISYATLPYDQNLTTLLHVAGMNTIEESARISRSPIFCYNIHV